MQAGIGGSWLELDQSPGPCPVMTTQLLLATLLLYCFFQALPAGCLPVKRQSSGREQLLPVDLFLGDESADTEPFLSDDPQVMDAATLLHIIEKLREEYTRHGQAEKVKASIDRLEANLHALTNGDKARTVAAEDTLAMLSEEESEEDTPKGAQYPDYYSDLYAMEEEDNEGAPDHSLLQLQAWANKVAGI